MAIQSQEEAITLVDVDITLDGNKIGAVEELSVAVAVTNEFRHQAGQADPVEIVSSKKEYTGSMTVSWINNNLIDSLFPSDQPVPYFDLVGSTKNKNPSRRIKILNAKGDGWDIGSLTLDGNGAKNALPFKALRIVPE